MNVDPYKNHLLDQALPVTDKLPIRAKVNAVLHAHAENRHLQLEPFPSRAVLKGEIHELILTVENAVPGAPIDQISYLCFFEIETAGVLWQFDRVEINGKPVGTLGGYDSSHLPNHMNVVIHSSIALMTGKEMKLQPGDPIEFVFQRKN
jgi:hypothetical protein